jgi:hypothetical protein
LPRLPPWGRGALRPLLDTYTPDPAWWLHNPYGWHGRGHAARVLVWTEQVVRYFQAQGVAVDAAAARWAAVLHDCRRQQERTDPGHGRRGAAWVLAHGATLGLTVAQARAVAHTIAWHVPEDRSCPRWTAELLALKDADSLDRVRFGHGAGFDPRYLRTPALRGRRPQATWLAAASNYLGTPADPPPVDPWDAVRAVAQDQGVWP